MDDLHIPLLPSKPVLRHIGTQLNDLANAGHSKSVLSFHLFHLYLRHPRGDGDREVTLPPLLSLAKPEEALFHRSECSRSIPGCAQVDLPMAAKCNE